jgi:hypothetical protein
MQAAWVAVVNYVVQQTFNSKYFFLNLFL